MMNIADFVEVCDLYRRLSTPSSEIINYRFTCLVMKASSFYVMVNFFIFYLWSTLLKRHAQNNLDCKA